VVKEVLEPVHSFMKARLNLTIETELLSEIKAYAADRKVSVSELVEDYFRKIAKPAKVPAIFEMVRNLQIPDDCENGIDWKKQYYEDNKAKYGF